MKNQTNLAALLMVAGGLALTPAAASAFNPCAPAGASRKINASRIGDKAAVNPCAAKANPCAANPCAAKANPCAANPCAAVNPCAANPCAAKKSRKRPD